MLNVPSDVDKTISSEMDRYYRGLIYTSCIGLLRSQQIVTALRLWEEGFAGQQTFSPMRFARKCRNTLNLDKMDTHALAHRITELSLGSLTMQEPATPIAFILEAQHKGSDGFKGISGQVAFKSLVGELLNMVWADRALVEPYLVGLDAASKQVLLDWSTAPTPRLNIPALTHKQRRDILLCIYDWLSALYPSIYADKLFWQAIYSTQRLGDTFGFDVNQI